MKINEKQTQRVNAIQNQIKELNQALQNYLTGVADTLEVPEGHIFDFEKMEFTAPTKNLKATK